MTKTEWFPSDMKPVRDGVYEALHGGWQYGFARWEGGRWQTLCPTTVEAAEIEFTHGASQSKQWRGLTTRGGKA